MKKSLEPVSGGRREETLLPFSYCKGSSSIGVRVSACLQGSGRERHASSSLARQAKCVEMQDEYKTWDHVYSLTWRMDGCLL